jgi:hypothetical protein
MSITSMDGAVGWKAYYFLRKRVLFELVEINYLELDYLVEAVAKVLSLYMKLSRTRDAQFNILIQ